MAITTKTELNAILKEAGFGSIKRQGKVLRDGGKIVKGIMLGSTGPMSISSPQYENLRKLARELLQEDLHIKTQETDYVVLECNKFTVSLYICSTRSYPVSEGYDPMYLTHYAQVTVKAK